MEAPLIARLVAMKTRQQVTAAEANEDRLQGIPPGDGDDIVDYPGQAAFLQMRRRLIHPACQPVSHLAGHAVFW